MITVAHLRLSSGPVDIMPPKFLSEVMAVTAPWLLSVFNISLSPGCVPEYLKTACVQPLIKKSSLNPSECGNYRPISKLPFLQKSLRKASPYTPAKCWDKTTFMKIFSQFLVSISLLRPCFWIDQWSFKNSWYWWMFHHCTAGLKCNFWYSYSSYSTTKFWLRGCSTGLV